MSAINLLTANPSSESASSTALLPPPSSSSRDGSARSFREELSNADTPNKTAAPRSEATPRTPRDAAEARSSSETSSPSGVTAAPDDTKDASAAEVSTQPTAAAEAVDTVEEVVEPVAVAATGATPVLDDAVVVEGEDPVLSLVADLVVAFENVFANTPVTEGLAEPAALASPQAPVLSALVAVYEALQAVTVANGISGLGSTSTLATATPVNPLAAPAPLAGGANGTKVAGPFGASSAATAGAVAPVPPVPVVSPENASTGQQSGGEAGGDASRQGSANNAATTAANSQALLSTAAQAGISPLVDPAATDPAGVRPLTTTIAPPTNSANATGLSTQINPAGLTETNSTQDALNSARLTRGLNSAVNQQNGAVTLRLTPPEMGTVRIQLNMQGGNVSAQFHAETESARTLLNQQLGQLRSSLEAQGLNVEKLGVQAMAGSSNSSGLQNQAGNDSSQNQAQNNADGRSRGQFGQSSQQGRQDPDDPTRNAPTEFTQLLDANPPESLDTPATSEPAARV